MGFDFPPEEGVTRKADAKALLDRRAGFVLVPGQCRRPESQAPFFPIEYGPQLVVESRLGYLDRRAPRLRRSRGLREQVGHRKAERARYCLWLAAGEAAQQRTAVPPFRDAKAGPPIVMGRAPGNKAFAALARVEPTGYL
jgi:hypothetical protein